MTDLDLVARLAKEAGMKYRTPGDYDEMHQLGMDGVLVETLARFSALVAEECAKVAEGVYVMSEDLPSGESYLEDAARKIRARFVHSPPAASERLAEPGRRSGPDLG